MKTFRVLLFLAAFPLFAATFKPPCKLPFASISTKDPIDADCGLSGAVKNPPALAAQDAAKNNFCATGTPAVLTFDVYPDLQAAAEKVLGGLKYRPPLNRKPLHSLYTWKKKKIGEGTLVSIVGYAEAAHYSDVDSGESVNCELKEDQNNDVHIPIVPTAGADECQSVTAEITPHFRPAMWTPSNVNMPHVPMRFTGQLMFDAEHKPCRGTTVEEPKRQSVWEIHPVYAVDVCTAAKPEQCDAANAKVWQPLDQWLKKH
jgi:hypothetical protein